MPVWRRNRNEDDSQNGAGDFGRGGPARGRDNHRQRLAAQETGTRWGDIPDPARPLWPGAGPRRRAERTEETRGTSGGFGADVEGDRGQRRARSRWRGNPRANDYSRG